MNAADRWPASATRLKWSRVSEFELTIVIVPKSNKMRLKQDLCAPRT